MKVLITGGSGFIGTNLTLFLQETNEDMQILNLDLKPPVEELLQLSDYRYIQGSILDDKIFETICSTWAIPDVVVHLAAQTGVIPSMLDPVKDMEINVLGTLKMLMYAKQVGAKQFILASSSAPLGNAKLPLNETRIPSPISPYGASKLAAEGYCMAMANDNLRCTILRFANVYGPFSENKDSFINKVIRAHFEDEESSDDLRCIEIYGDGEQTRDFIYVEEVCEAIWKTIIHFKAVFSTTGHRYPIHIGTGEPVSLNRVLNIVRSFRSLTDIGPIQIRRLEDREGEVRVSYVDTSAARELIGFENSISIELGMALTWRWYSNSK